VAFFYHLDIAIFDRQLEKSDFVVVHKLGGHCTADQLGKFFGTAGDVLLSLNYAVLVAPSFCLNGYNKLPAEFIDANVDFIDFNLADCFYSGS